nr:hypothetical protein Iba_chr06bCG13650 [Ipomoea batatas]
MLYWQLGQAFEGLLFQLVLFGSLDALRIFVASLLGSTNHACLHRDHELEKRRSLKPPAQPTSASATARRRLHRTPPPTPSAATPASVEAFSPEQEVEVVVVQVAAGRVCIADAEILMALVAEIQVVSLALHHLDLSMRS